MNNNPNNPNKMLNSKINLKLNIGANFRLIKAKVPRS